MEVSELKKSSELNISDLIPGQLQTGKPSQLLIDDHTHDVIKEQSQQDLPTVKGQQPDNSPSYGNYKKQQVTVKSPTDVKKKVVQKYVKKVDIKVKAQDLSKGSKSNSKAKLSHRARPVSQKAKFMQDNSSSDQQTEQISPSKTSNGSVNSYGIHGVDELTIHEKPDKPQSSLSHPSKKNTSVQISRKPTDYYIGKIKYHSKFSNEPTIDNINIQENNTSAQVTVNDLLMENRQSTENLKNVMQRLNPKSNQMLYLQQSQPNLVSLDNQFGLIHSTAQNKKLTQKVKDHFQNIYSTQKNYKEARHGGNLGVRPSKKREYGSYIEKFLDYQSRHNLRNPMTKLKVINSQSKNTMRFNTHLGGSTLGVALEGAHASIRIPVGKGSGEQISFGTSNSVLELIEKEQRTKDLSRDLRESISMDSFHEDLPGHLVQLNDSGLKISTREELDRETSRSMLAQIRHPSNISLNNHQFHMKRDSQNHSSVISSHKNKLHQKQMKLLGDPSNHKKVKKLTNTNKGISQIYDSKVQKLQEKLNTLEEEMESNLDVDHTYMVQVMTHDEPEHQKSNSMKIQVQSQRSPQSFGGINTEYNQATRNEQNFFKSKDGNQSNYASPKKVAISLLKNENLNVIKHQKQSLGENYDDTYTESPSFTKTGSQKLIGNRRKTRNGSAANSRDGDKGMIVINSKNYTSNMHSTRRNSQIDAKVRNKSNDSGNNSNVTERDKKERADGFSAYIAEQQQLAEMNQMKDYNTKLQKQYEENQKKLQSYNQNQNLNTKKVVLDINQGIISQSLSHGDSRGSLHDETATDIFKPQMNHQYNVINFGGDISQTENVSRANDTQNQSRGSKDDLSTIIGTPKPLINKHPVSRKIKDRKKTPVTKADAQADFTNQNSQGSLINIMDSSQITRQQPISTRNVDTEKTHPSLVPIASNKSILKLQELVVHAQKPLSNKNSMAMHSNSNGQFQNSSTSSPNDKRNTNETPLSKRTGYILNSSGPSLVRQSNKQSIDSLIIRKNNVINMDSSPFIKIDVQTRQQKKTQKREKALSKEMKEMKFNIQGGVQIIVSPDTRELVNDSNRQSNKSPSQKNLNPNQKKLEQMLGSNPAPDKLLGHQFIIKGHNKSAIKHQSQGQDNPEHDEHFAEVNLALSSVDSAYKQTNHSGMTLRPTLSKSHVDGASNTTFMNTLSQNAFLQPRNNIVEQNLQMQSPNGISQFEGIPYKGMRGSVTNKNMKNFKNILRKQQNQIEKLDTQGLPGFGMKYMGLEGIPLSPSLKPIEQTQFQTPQMFSPSVLVPQANFSNQNSQGTQATQSPVRGSPSKKKIFSRVRDLGDTKQSDVKVQTNRINELVQRRNSQSVFQTQHKLDANNRALLQMQSFKENLDMSSVYQMTRKGGSLNRNSKAKKQNAATRLPNIYNINIEQNFQEMELQRHKTMLEQYASQNQDWSQNLGNGAIPNQNIKNSSQRQNEISQLASIRQSHESQKKFSQENSNINPQELIVLNIQKINQMQRPDPNRSPSMGHINQDLLDEPLNYSRNKHSHQVSIPRVRVEKERSRPWRDQVPTNIPPPTKAQNLKSPKPPPQYGDIHFQAGAGAQTGSSIDNAVSVQNIKPGQKHSGLSLNIVPARSSVENQQFQKDGGLQPWGSVTHHSPKPPPRVQHQKFKIRKIEVADPHALGAYAGHEQGPTAVTSVQEESIVIGSQLASSQVPTQYDPNLMKKASSMDSSVVAGVQDVKSTESQKQTIEIQIQN